MQWTMNLFVNSLELRCLPDAIVKIIFWNCGLSTGDKMALCCRRLRPIINIFSEANHTVNTMFRFIYSHNTFLQRCNFIIWLSMDSAHHYFEALCNHWLIHILGNCLFVVYLYQTHFRMKSPECIKTKQLAKGRTGERDAWNLLSFCVCPFFSISDQTLPKTLNTDVPPIKMNVNDSITGRKIWFKKISPSHSTCKCKQNVKWMNMLIVLFSSICSSWAKVLF